jgi:hypothetical protein
VAGITEHGEPHQTPSEQARNLSKRGSRAAFLDGGRYMSDRWRGDAYLLAKLLNHRLAEAAARISA